MTTNSAARMTPVKRQVAIGLLATLGSINALYLTWIKSSNSEAACAGIGDCDAVNNSLYSEIFGIPVAMLGLALYVFIVVLVCLEARRPKWTFWIQLAVFGLALAGMLFSGWLTYVEIEILQLICPYCILSAVLIVAIFTLSFIDLVKGSVITD